MKIGFVTQSYYPVRGGVTEHVYHLGRELARRGHEVAVITGATREPPERELRVIRVGRVVPMNMNGATVSMVIGWRIGNALRAIEDRERFDLVHVHQPLEPFLSLTATLSMRSPLVGTFHTYRATNPYPILLGARYARAINRLRRRIAVSQSAASFITNTLAVPFEIIPNGVDCSRFAPSVAAYPAFRDGTVTVLYVGRMDPRKGARYLFGALPYLERELHDYRILVVGSGWRRNVYARFIPLGMERRVVFAGPATWEELPRYYRSADIFCSPAVGGESFGIVLLEAMASGLPIVASDIEGYRHVMTDGREGLFSRARDPRSIAGKIVKLVKDRDLRAHLGAAGRSAAMNYDWEKITDSIEGEYRRVVESTRKK